MKSIGIIGYGRMGQIMEQAFNLLEEPLDILRYDYLKENPQKPFADLRTTAGADLVIVCVPIDAFESVSKKVAEFLKPGQTILHICSVQVHPKQVFLKHVPVGVNIIGTHPMFGPQTLKYNENCFEGLNFVIESIRADQKIYKEVLSILKHIKFNVVEMTADDHDQKAAKFHFLSHIVANTLTGMGLEKTPIDTKSYEFLFKFLDRISPDTSLLQNMLTYNPYAQIELEKFSQTFSLIKKNLILPQNE